MSHLTEESLLSGGKRFSHHNIAIVLVFSGFFFVPAQHGHLFLFLQTSHFLSYIHLKCPTQEYKVIYQHKTNYV